MIFCQIKEKIFESEMCLFDSIYFLEKVYYLSLNDVEFVFYIANIFWKRFHYLTLEFS